MRYVVVDLEATCDEAGFSVDKMETIEIGAVRLATAEGPALDEFGAFVQPVVTRELTEFCRSLTTIAQSDVDAAEPFYTVFARFMAWLASDPEPFVFCSWGAYDLKQLQRDCARHKIEFPASMMRHINLKAEFARQFGVKPMGMSAALAQLKIPATGTHHRGIDDARNIARIAVRILPATERQQ